MYRFFQNTLVNGSSNAHVANAPNRSTPLFSDDGDTLHDSPTPVTLPLDRSRLIPKWAISTLVDATKFLVGPSTCYQEESPPPWVLLAHIVDCFWDKSNAAEFLVGPFEHYQEESSPP
jgi:hypothetical protein